MKKEILALLFILFFILISCEEQNTYYDWNNVSVYSNLYISSIYMIDDEIGYVGGYADNVTTNETIYMGEIFEFEDTLIYSPDNGHFYREFEFVDSLPNPILYKTKNGGKNWTAIDTPFRTGIIDMQFINEDVGFVISEKEGVYRTLNGGESWNKILESVVHYYYGSILDDPYSSVSFYDENLGFVYGEQGGIDMLLLTSNAGNSWQCVSFDYPAGKTGSCPFLFDDLEKLILFSSSDTGYIINNSQLYKTTDLGKRWERILTPKPVDAEKVYFDNPQVIYLTNQNHVTRDGGTTWTSDDSGIYGDNLVLIDQKEIFYLQNGSIYRKTVGNPEFHLMTKEREVEITDLFFPSDRVGYAVGSESTVLKYVRE